MITEITNESICLNVMKIKCENFIYSFCCLSFWIFGSLFIDKLRISHKNSFNVSDVFDTKSTLKSPFRTTDSLFSPMLSNFAHPVVWANQDLFKIF